MLGGYPVSGLLSGTFPAGFLMDSISFEDGIVYLGEGVLKGQRLLKTLDFPASACFFMRELCAECRALSTVFFRGDLAVFSDGVFMNCAALEAIELPAEIPELPEQTFWGCRCLKEITLPQTVAVLDDYCFFGSGITSLRLPLALNCISPKACLNCGQLKSFDVAEENEFYKVISGVLYDRTGRRLIRYPPGKIEAEFDIPEDVTMLEEYAFYECKNLLRLDCSDSIENVPAHCFAWCENLESITLPAKLTEMEAEAMCYCGKISTLSFADSLQRFGNAVFWGCGSLISVTFDGICPEFPEIVGVSDLDVTVWLDDSWDSVNTDSLGCIHYNGENLPSFIRADGGEGLLFSGEVLLSFGRQRLKSGMSIYYTLDGTTPTFEDGRLFSKELKLQDTALLRYRGFRNGKPVTIGRKENYVEINNIPEGAVAEFKISRVAEVACVIEDYLGKDTTLKIPAEIDGLKCIGVASSAFAGHLGMRVLEFPLQLQWIEGDAFIDMPELKAVILSENTAIIWEDKEAADAEVPLFFWEKFSRLLVLAKGWNDVSFPVDVMAEKNERLFGMLLFVVRQQAFCHEKEKILATEGVWIWSMRETITPYCFGSGEANE